MKWEGVGDYFFLMGSQPHILSELVDSINTHLLSTFSKLLALMGLLAPCHWYCVLLIKNQRILCVLWGWGDGGRREQI